MIARRGFLLITVMTMLVLSTMMVGWGLKRATMRNLIAERRLESYRMHHERQGVRALAGRWLRAAETRGALELLAQHPVLAYRAELPNEAVVTFRVFGAQGSVLARVDDAGSDEIRERLIDALRLLPDDRPDLCRPFGPVRTDLRFAPDEVIYALAGGDTALAESLQQMRDEPPADRGQMMSRLLAQTVDDRLARQIVSVLGVTTSLWAIQADVYDRLGQRRYEVIAELQGSDLVIYSIKQIAIEPDDEAQHRGYVAPDRGSGPMG